MNKKIKLVAIDIDGTLLDSKENISKNTKEIIEKLNNNGTHIVLSTGRTFLSAYNIMKKLSLDIPIVSYNGGSVYIPSEGQIFSLKIPVDIGKRVIKFGEDKGLYVKVYIDDVLYVKEDDPVSIAFSKNHGIKYEAVGKLTDKINKDINMIVMFAEEKYDRVPEYFDDLKISITASTPYSMEFLPEGTSKATGLKKILDHFGISRVQVMAIGNGLNDYEMIKYAGLGIAMKNSDEKLLDKWDKVSEFTNDEEGVYHILKRLSTHKMEY